MELTGTIKSIGQAQQVSDTFSKKEFTIEIKNGSFTDLVALQFVKDKISKLDGYNIGDNVRVHFNISSREYNGKYFTNCTAWGITKEAQQAAPQQQATGGADDTSLPF